MIWVLIASGSSEGSEQPAHFEQSQHSLHRCHTHTLSRDINKGSVIIFDHKTVYIGEYVCFIDDCMYACFMRTIG